MEEKFCKFCGNKIPMDAVMCTHCGRQVEELKQNQSQPNIVINNTASNVNSNNINAGSGNVKNKWVAFFLCLFFGFFGFHKFYEGKILLGLVYLFTVGLFGIGWILDLISLFFKPLHYTV